MIRILTIPFDSDKELFDESAVNNFLMNKKLKSMETQFFTSGDKPYWTVFVEYEPILQDVKSEKNREKESSMTDVQKHLYLKLKEWRKEKAEKAGIPVYVVATNSELMEVVVCAPETLENLKSIKGFGSKKVEKYGKELVSLIKTYFEKS